MGLSRLFTKLPKPADNVNNPFAQSLQSIPKSPPFHSLLPNPEKGTSDYQHSSTQHFKNQILVDNQVPVLKNHHGSSLSQIPVKGSLSFLPTAIKHLKDSILINNQSLVGANSLWVSHHFHAKSIHGGLVNLEAQIAEDTDKLCKILSNHSGSLSEIEPSLDGAGIRMLSPALVEEVLKKLSNAGVLALSFFRWAGRVGKKQGFSHTSDTYNALIEALGKIKQFKMIWNLVDEMKSNGLLKKETFALIMRRYARARKTKEAIETYKKMEKFGMILDISDFNRLVDTLSKSGHVKKANEMFDEMKKKKVFLPDIRTYSILLEGWGQERNIVMVEEVIREMKDDGFEPDIVTYGIIINAYCKSRKYDEALEVVHQMEEKKLELSPHIYCTLINGLGAEKRLQEAMEFFDQSKKLGLTPELPTYNAVVGSYCYSMQFNDAFKVIEEMKQCGLAPNSRTYEIILHHLIRNRKTQQAYLIYEKMETEFGVVPSLNTYGMIMTMFCNEERVDKALMVWNQMRDKGIIPSMHMFSTLINGLCQENRLDDACIYFQEMLDVGLRPPGQVYGNLKHSLLEAGKKDIAISLGLKLDRIRKTPLVE